MDFLSIGQNQTTDKLVIQIFSFTILAKTLSLICQHVNMETC